MSTTSARSVVSTALAPKVIGTCSQAVRAGDTVYLSGQIPLGPVTMDLVPGDIRVQIARVFDNLKAVAEAAEGGLSDVVKLNVYLSDLIHFPVVNEVMAGYFREPNREPGCPLARHGIAWDCRSLPNSRSRRKR